MCLNLHKISLLDLVYSHLCQNCLTLKSERVFMYVVIPKYNFYAPTPSQFVLNFPILKFGSLMHQFWQCYKAGLLWTKTRLFSYNYKLLPQIETTIAVARNLSFSDTHSQTQQLPNNTHLASIKVAQFHVRSHPRPDFNNKNASHIHEFPESYFS